MSKQMINKQFCEEFLQVARDFESSPLASFGPGKGSLSARDYADDELVVITPSGMQFSCLTPEDLIVLDLQGNIVDGKRKPSLDRIFHLAVYNARPDVNGIVHTHSPYATAYASMAKTILPLIMSLVITVGGNVDVAPFAFPGTEELGKVVVTGLADKNAVLMEQHGVLAVGKDLSRALAVAGTVENVAQIQAISESLGNVRPLDEETIRQGLEFEKGYGQTPG
ncbi:MAG: class II aldolase/adducin family protein [Chloroflexi bacterium]|nr:class II aldolase/adducin family protein [Chloroflexota bacterium]